MRPIYLNLFVLMAISVPAFGQTAADPWLILASGEQGSINVHTTREDLVRVYGAANVVDQDADVGDGEIEPVTFLFPQDPERRIEILWKDPDRRADPREVGTRGKKSRWHGVHGVSLGTTLIQLQRINSRPFRLELLNDGTDMRNELISWHGGSLENEFQGEGRVILWLVGSSTKDTRQTRPQDFAGESDEPAMRAWNLRISEMSWLFPSKKRH